MKYKVNMARVTWLTATVEADNEGEALEKAYEVVPSFSALESGWGKSDWAADAEEWLPVDEFYDVFGKYDAKQHGVVVEKSKDN